MMKLKKKKIIFSHFVLHTLKFVDLWFPNILSLFFPRTLFSNNKQRMGAAVFLDFYKCQNQFVCVFSPDGLDFFSNQTKSQSSKIERFPKKNKALKIIDSTKSYTISIIFTCFHLFWQYSVNLHFWLEMTVFNLESSCEQ